jgi:DNA-binding transcriptional regulator YiaG
VSTAAGLTLIEHIDELTERTKERDRARAIAVTLEQEVAQLRKAANLAQAALSLLAAGSISDARDYARIAYHDHAALIPPADLS